MKIKKERMPTFIYSLSFYLEGKRKGMRTRERERKKKKEKEDE